jgi:hypothetical protein
LAFDVETTGLDVLNDQVLEIGAVVDDITPAGNLPPLAALPTFRMAVRHGRIRGTPSALAMNAGLIARIARGECVAPQYAAFQFRQFVSHHFGKDCPVVAGKNVWKLDVPMMTALMHEAGVVPGSHPGGRHEVTFADSIDHRALDVGPMFARPSDRRPPGLDECVRRAGGDPAVFAPDHDPVQDCLKVLFCIRYHWRKPS